MRYTLSVLLLFFTSVVAVAQAGYWQQKVEYTMDIQMDVNNNQFRGQQKLVYTNNSPDTLSKVFFHLYFNAFQPGSMMDARSRTIVDPDRRITKIQGLKDNEIGYQKVNELTQNGKKVKFETVGTILEVELAEAILPGQQTSFDMNYDAQVPIQIRRSGRDNAEGIRYSMTQWYPKMVEYDVQGWHPNPYVSREFHGVWGDFDVTIHIPQEYVLGATGYLQNPEVMDNRFEGEREKESVQEERMLSWHFIAPMVHDFAWVADPDYEHQSISLDNGTVINFLFQRDSSTVHWDSLPKYAKKCFEIMNEQFGEYPYKQYTVAQGGDGGMEYPMITLITGNRSLRSLVGVTVHEALHSWYQHLLGTNEAQYAWMDEGFTSYASDVVMSQIWPSYTPHIYSYRAYVSYMKSGKQEVLTTHADHFETNYAYGRAAYTMGAVFLHQLSYIMGQNDFMVGMRRYFEVWNQKHPTPNDFIRIMEKQSGMQLKWYLEQWTETLNTIDYGIKLVQPKGKQSRIRLERIGRMPMPLDVAVTDTDGKVSYYHIPLRIMRGAKEAEEGMDNFVVLEDWAWTFPEYAFTIDLPYEKIKSIEIDPSKRMADIELGNNVFPPKASVIFEAD